jgi:hypothetical protein
VAQQTLDFIIANQVTGMNEVANLIKKVGALDAEIKKINTVLKDMGANFDSASGKIRGLTNPLDAQSKALRNQRQGMQMAGMQVNDFATSISTGASLTQAFNQQIGQLGYAFSMMEGRAGAVGRFLAGPWSIAVIGAAMVLGPMIENLLGVGKASESTSDSLADLVEKKRQSSAESRMALVAEDAFGRTLDGVRVAIDANMKAMEALNRVKRTSAEESLNQAKKTMLNALMTRFDTHQQLMNAQALLEAQVARASGPGQGADLAALGIKSRMERVQELTVAFAEGAKEIVRAQNAVNEAQSYVTVERGLESVEDQITRRYDAEIDGARKAAVARGETGQQLQKEVEAIRRARDAELDRYRESGRSARGASAELKRLEDARKRELNQAESIAEKIRDMGLVYGASNKQIGESAKKLDDFNDMVLRLKSLEGGEKIYEELAGTIALVRKAIVDEGAHKALQDLDGVLDKILAKDLSPLERGLKDIDNALSNPELAKLPTDKLKAALQEVQGARAALFAAPFQEAEEAQTKLLEQAMGVDNSFKVVESTLLNNIKSAEAMGLPVEEYIAQLERIKGINQQIGIVEKNKEIQRSYEAIGQSVADGFKGMITGAQSFGDAMRGIIQSVIDELFRLFVVQQIVGFISNVASGAFGGAGASPGSSRSLGLGGYAGAAGATGGYPAPGKPVMVGERGPELFVPTSSGKIIPNHQMSAGGGMTINVDARGSTDPEAVKRQVQQGILEAAPSIVAAAEQRTISTLRRPRLAGVM